MKNGSGVSARAKYAARRRANLLRTVCKPGAPETKRIDPAIVAELESKLISVSHENAQLRDGVARLRAEFDNFRRRTAKEKDQIRDTAREDTIIKLLPVLDNFERALQSTQTAVEAKSIRDGITMVSAQLTRLLEAEGLQRIAALNAAFNPNEHEALATEERDDFEENHVSEEMLPGYRFKEKIIRPAMVKVAKAPAEKSPVQ